MKLILSRKSFDSAYGGKPNLIFPDGKLLSLPIPGKRYVKKINFNNQKYNPTEYKDVQVPINIRELLIENNISGIDNYAKLILNLFSNYKGNKILTLKEGLSRSLLKELNRKAYYCHLDPDLIYDNLERLKGWRGIFGPHPNYHKNLKEIISENDLILFFGTFRHIIIDNGAIRYAKHQDGNNLVYNGKHILYGYLQIKKIITKEKQLEPWMYKPYHHPHLDEKLWCNENRALYVAKKHLYINGKKTTHPGYGIFNFNPNLILTEEGATKSIWKKELFPINSKIIHQGKEIRQDKWTENGCFKWDTFGQEFIIESCSLFEKHVKEKIFNFFK